MSKNGQKLNLILNDFTDFRISYNCKNYNYDLNQNYVSILKN